MVAGRPWSTIGAPSRAWASPSFFWSLWSASTVTNKPRTGLDVIRVDGVVHLIPSSPGSSTHLRRLDTLLVAVSTRFPSCPSSSSAAKGCFLLYSCPGGKPSGGHDVARLAVTVAQEVVRVPVQMVDGQKSAEAAATMDGGFSGKVNVGWVCFCAGCGDAKRRRTGAGPVVPARGTRAACRPPLQQTRRSSRVFRGRRPRR